MDFLKRIAKAIIGGISAASAPEIINAIGDASIVWGWQYALASFLGVGIAVYVIPNKPQGA